jgi:outer membrane immunogenic protein
VRWLIATSAATSMAIVTLVPLGARAADLPPAVPGPAVYAPPAAYRAVANWGGFYVGGNVGVGFARDQSTFSFGGVPFATTDTALFGAVGGGQAGFNWQSGALVLGAEADFDWANAKGSISAQCAVCAPTANATLEHDVDWFGTARARVGYAADGWLAYVTGGYAFARVALKGTATAGGASASLTQNSTPSGWTIGGGAELALGPDWSARLEYLYVDLGTVNNTIVVPGAPALTDSARVQMNVVRVGVNYRF